jgi:uncharacterized membrane protein HdeD (DUF308 family)
MVQAMAKNWWLFLIRGILSIVFGALTLFMPGLTLLLLITFYGAYAVVDGVMTIWSAFSGRGANTRWWVHLLEGIVSIVAGVIAFTLPEIAAVTLVLVIGAWAVFTGIAQIVQAVRLRKEIDNELWLGLSGALSVIFGVYVFLFPGAGALGLTWIIGVYAIIFGGMFIGLAFRLRSQNQSGQQNPPSRATA